MKADRGEQVKEDSMKTVLFLCTGNYYRSRYAELFFNHLAYQQGLPWRASSRGLALNPLNPGPISRKTIERLRDRGIPVQPNHRLPIDVTQEDFNAAFHVVAVKEAEHLPLVRRRFPSIVERVEFWHVHDVDCVGPEVALPHLEREVMELIERLSMEGGVGTRSNRTNREAHQFMEYHALSECSTCGERFDFPLTGCMTFVAEFLMASTGGKCPKCGTQVVFEGRPEQNIRLAAAKSQEEICSVPVEDVHLSVRCVNLLNKSGIESLGALLRLTRKELADRLRSAPSCMDEVDRLLVEYNLKLAEK
jgi:protein-tyrosine phosphatase